MNTNINTLDSTGEKRLPETSGQNIPHNLTTIQNIQGIQNIVQSNVQTIQSTQNAVSTMAPTSTIVGKSISLDLNPKLSLMKSVVQSGTAATVEANKITTTLCPVGSTVRIISPGMLSAVERQTQPQAQAQVTQQVVTTIPATYHVPRGPAAVANISAPRSTVATPIVRASGGPSVVPISRTGVSTTVSNTSWPAKTSVVYAQPQRHIMPPAGRITTRPAPAVYSGQQPRLVVPAQARSVQATVVATAPPGASPRLLTPVLQSNNTITRIPVSQVRPAGPQVANVTTSAVQAVRHQSQTLQTNQQVTRVTTAQTNRITVSTPVVGTTSRIATAASVTVQPAIGRQLSINPATGTATTGFNRVVIPAQQVQHQSQSHQQGPRVVQTVTSLANIGTVSRVIATTTNPSNVARVTQSAPTSVARITGMTLHSLPISTTRTIPAPVKSVVTTGQAIAQTVQIKSGGQPSGLRVTPIVSTTTLTTTTTPVPLATATTAPTATIIINNNNNSINSPTTVTQPALYTQYRSTSVQPVRLLVEPAHEDGHGKPNASPRPSILRKRDHDNSPAKSVAKNLVPVLSALSSNVVMPPSSPPSPSRNDRDGCHSSGSTTVSATSSPGLDEEPEQSRIIINQTTEMSPRKKPRKQQLTGVELTEPRCNEEEMQFITEDKLRREKDDMRISIKDKYCVDRKTHTNNQPDSGGMMTNATMVVRTRPTPSLLGSSWKNRWSGRLHHYRRPSDVRSREDRRPTVAEIAQQKYVLQKIHGWKVYQLTAQMEDLAELEKQVHEKLKTTLLMLEPPQPKPRKDDDLERINDLIKGNMQRSSLISEGMSEARTQLVAIFQHKGHVNDILQRCGNKRAQKKRDK